MTLLLLIIATPITVPMAVEVQAFNIHTINIRNLKYNFTMKTTKKHWKKTELQIYVLLLCANADSMETDEEINLIKSKTDPDTFNKMYKEFISDTLDESLEKIQQNIYKHYYSHMELIEFRKEVNAVFLSDKKIHQMERNLDRILDNIIY